MNDTPLHLTEAQCVKLLRKIYPENPRWWPRPSACDSSLHIDAENDFIAAALLAERMGKP